MNPGIFRHRITLLNPVEQTAVTGETVQTWQDVATVWAAIEPVQGREVYLAQKLQPEITHKIIMRYRPGVTSDMRVKYGNRVFWISGIVNPEERNITLELLCIEKPGSM